MKNGKLKKQKYDGDSLLVYNVPRGIYYLFHDWLDEQQWLKEVKHSIFPTEHTGIYNLYITSANQQLWEESLKPTIVNYFYAHIIVSPVKNTDTL